MTPDPATNPAPETPTPDIVKECAKAICKSFQTILEENGVQWNPAHSLIIIEEWIGKCVIAENDALSAECLRLKADKERLDWLEKVDWGISNWLDDNGERVWMAWDNNRGDEHTVESKPTLRAAIDRATEKKA